MAHPAVALEVDRRLDVEDHAGLQHVVGRGVQAGAGGVVDRGEADAVAGAVGEGVVAEAVPADHVAGGGSTSLPARGTDGRERGGAGLEHRIVHPPGAIIRLAEHVGPGDVGPVAADVGVAVDEREVRWFEAPAARRAGRRRRRGRRSGRTCSR